MRIKEYGSAHNHTDYSNYRLRDSINELNELCWYAAKELGHSFIAITDHEAISTSIRIEDIQEKIRKEYPDFKIIRGNEIYLCRNGLNKENYIHGKDKFYHFILLAKDEIGHQQIRELSTRAWLRSEEIRRMQRVPTYYNDLIEVIGSNKGHVIFSTACIGGKLGQMILNDVDKDYIKQWIVNLSAICGKENFFLETQPSYNKEQIKVNQKIKELSLELGFKVIITTDAHYLKKEDFNIHKAFLNAQGGDRETESFYASTYMMDTNEIQQYMNDSIGEETVIEWLKNSKYIYDMCTDYSLKKPLRIPYLPRTINKITDEQFNMFADKIDELEYFYKSKFAPNRDLAAAIVTKILKEPDTYNNLKTFEHITDNLKAVRLLSEKQGTQWSAYLLNMRDYVDLIWTKGDSLVGPSRGSGGGFELLNILDITQINPAKEKAPLRSWRFLNPERVSPLDIDTDIEGGKRAQVYRAFQEEYGKDRVSKVLTIRTEKSKSALLTSCRGLGVDPDTATYLASFIKADRGLPRTLHQTFYGDIENDIPPDKKFQDLMTNEYSEVWEVAQKIEGLCCGVGSHAGGVIFYDEDITNTTALMKTDNGDLVTQYDLHRLEDVGLIKIDLLSIEALDRIRACLDLLVKYGYIDATNKTLKEIYEETIGIYNIERENPEMWKLLHNHKVQALFQMEQDSGIKGIALTKPQTVEELASINSVMRLMAPEKGQEQPLETFAKRKMDSSIWENEMVAYGLNQDERAWLHKWLDVSYGICETQETLMSMLQEPEIGGHSLLFADKVRKAIAKKKPEEFLACQKVYYEIAQEKGLSKTLTEYTWNVVFAASKGYSFCMAHTLAYSLVGLQELNLAFKYPLIFWNTANLIVDSGSMNLSEEFLLHSDNENLTENDDEDEEEKVKNSSADYGRIATAIGKMKKEGLKFTCPDINRSDVTFVPDIENDTIIYGLRGITRIGNNLIKEILQNRPFNSMQDFLNKVKVNKTQMISLIKSGAFDSFYNGDRTVAMNRYLLSIADTKNTVNLRNMMMLIKYNLLPAELMQQIKVFNFNKYLKNNKDGDYYNLDKVSFPFFSKYYDTDLLRNTVITEDGVSSKIFQSDWDRIYKKEMDPVRDYLKANCKQVVDKLNQILLNEITEKYAKGNISKWEMDSLSFYYHDHELQTLREDIYEITNFFDLSEEPEVDYEFSTKDGKKITMYKLSRIAGTVIDKNKNKGTVVLLTKYGVVSVKIWKNQFAVWDKRISEVGSDDKKHVIEESWFKRGTKLIIMGVRRDNDFVPKKYKNSEGALFEKIEELDEKGFITSSMTEREEG